MKLEVNRLDGTTRLRFPLLISGGLIEAEKYPLTSSYHRLFPLLISGGLIEAVDIVKSVQDYVIISAAN